MSRERFAFLVQPATFLPPAPIEKISLHKTGRKLKASVSAEQHTTSAVVVEQRNMVVLHLPQEIVRIYPKHKPMSVYHHLQKREGKKKAQH